MTHHIIRIKSSGQNDKPEYSRYEYEGMVPIADDQGRQVPDQKGQRQILPAPVLIQKGLSVDTTGVLISGHFSAWDHRQAADYKVGKRRKDPANPRGNEYQGRLL